MRGLLLLALVAGPLLLTRGARADASSPLRGWYGWQIALADAAAVGLALAPVDESYRGATATIGLTGLFINGSVINMTHGNAVGATRSLLRLPAFLIGRLVGFAAGGLFCEEAGCKGPLLTAGSAFGVGTVMLLDLLDAFEPTPWWLPEPAPLPPPPGTRTSPLAQHDPGGRRGARATPGPATAFTWPLLAGRF